MRNLLVLLAVAMRNLLVLLIVAMTACAARPAKPTEVYSAALSRYMRGESFDQVSHELALGSRDEARGLVHEAMLELSRRYYADR